MVLFPGSPGDWGATEVEDVPGGRYSVVDAAAEVSIGVVRADGEGGGCW